MNFFGHACVAARVDSDPRVLLGAMLPDFASMSRTRLAGSEDPAVAAGIALHLATDDVFHGARGFLTLYSRGIDRLEAAGLDRGPARAVAHVGTELLLDGLLLGDPSLDAAYLEAVALPLDELGLSFRKDGGERFRSLHARLSDHGLPVDYRSPERIAERLEQILARRPRLALAPGDREKVVPYLVEARDELEAVLPVLLAEVYEGLELPGV